jgi:hypothetical protein
MSQIAMLSRRLNIAVIDVTIKSVCNVDGKFLVWYYQESNVQWVVRPSA